MRGSHGYYADAVIDGEVNNIELAKKIAARTGFKAYECQSIIAAIAEVVTEETRQSNRVSLSDENGTRFVTFYPRVRGSVTDLEVERETTRLHAEDPSVEIRTQAKESDLTPDRLTWTLASTVGIKFSKQFSMGKQMQKVRRK